MGLLYGRAGRLNTKKRRFPARAVVARRVRALVRQPFVGVLVELAGLVGAAEHNGKRAMVRSTVLARPCHCVLRVSCSNSLPHSAYRRITVRGGRMAVEVTAPGARCCATCRRSSATRSSCWSRRPGAGARGSAWTYGRRTLCWRTCRPARGAPPGPKAVMAPAAAVRCSSHECLNGWPRFSTSTSLGSRVSNGPC